MITFLRTFSRRGRITHFTSKNEQIQPNALRWVPSILPYAKKIHVLYFAKQKKRKWPHTHTQVHTLTSKIKKVPQYFEPNLVWQMRRLFVFLFSPQVSGKINCTREQKWKEKHASKQKKRVICVCNTAKKDTKIHCTNIETHAPLLVWGKKVIICGQKKVITRGQKRSLCANTLCGRPFVCVFHKLLERMKTKCSAQIKLYTVMKMGVYLLNNNKKTRHSFGVTTFERAKLKVK